MSKKLLSLLIIALALGQFTVRAQTGAPAKGSKERRAILNALRQPVEKELKQKIQFRIDNFKMRGDWAFLNGAPQAGAGGGAPDYRNTAYQIAIDDGAFDNNFQALLKKTGGKWKLVTYAIGCTDVCWLGWDKQYKAPAAIFPGAQ